LAESNHQRTERGAAFDDPTHLYPDFKKAGDNTEKLVKKLDKTTGVKTIYLLGLNKTSSSSHFVHGLDYPELKNEKDLASYLNSQRGVFHIPDSFTVIEAEVISDYSIYTKVRTPNGIFS